MLSTKDTVLVIFFTVSIIVCLILNAIICVAYSYRRRSPRRPANLLMLNITVTDLLIAVFILPRHVFMKIFDYPGGKASDVLCKLISGGGFLWISLSASELLLAALAVERYISVIYPYNVRNWSSTKVMGRLLGICWTFAVVVNLPSICVVRYDQSQDFCMEEWPAWSSPKTYVIFIFCVGITSVVSMCVLYTRIILQLWRRQRKATEMSQIARLKARKRVTLILIQVTVVHMLCRMPNYVYYVLTYYSLAFTYGSFLYEITILLILINSMLHPYLIYWQTQGFRQLIKQVIHPLCAQKENFIEQRTYSVNVS